MSKQGAYHAPPRAGSWTFGAGWRPFVAGAYTFGGTDTALAVRRNAAGARWTRGSAEPSPHSRVLDSVVASGHMSPSFTVKQPAPLIGGLVSSSR